MRDKVRCPSCGWLVFKKWRRGVCCYAGHPSRLTHFWHRLEFIDCPMSDQPLVKDVV